MTTKLEANPDLQSFREFVKGQAEKRNLSMRKLSLAIGMAPSYFSEILSGKKRINVSFLNSLADYLQMPRVEVYQAAGWLDLEGDDLMYNQVKDWYFKDPYFREAVLRMIDMDENQRDKMFSWLFYKTLQETEHPQLNTIDLKLGNPLETGALRLDVLEKLPPEERQALIDVVKFILEVYLAKRSKGEGEKF
jgi:transcriptional regulator with XRE-family HTH domain